LGFRFHRSIRLLPGVRINLSRRGISTTIGPRGASVNVRSRGTYANVGLPGTGLSSRTRLDSTGHAQSRPAALTGQSTPADSRSSAEPSTPRGRPVWRWILLGILIGVGAMLVLGV
jgi:hypothetical protein